MKFIVGVVAILMIGAAIFLFLESRNISVEATISPNFNEVAATSSFVLPLLPERQIPTSTVASSAANTRAAADIPNQLPLPSPPLAIKGIYVTGWSAGYAPKINSLINLAERTELNAMVIDIKDYSGYVSYRTTVQATKEIGAEGEIRIAQPNALIKKLHDANIYVVGRITVFQDPILAKAHPEWALQNKLTGKTWVDNKGLAWMDPAAEGVWKYNLGIAEDALARGFDEINFDYVRFASDGDLSNISYPFWDGKTPKHTVIENFFRFLRENAPGAKISVDLFGLSTINADDLGIGQVIEDAYKYFDYVSPMVYPSHYASGFLGYANPAKYPYEVIKYSMERALVRVAKGYEQTAADSTSTVHAQFASKLRPWLQDFDLGATYDASMVKKEMLAVEDVLVRGSISLTVPANTSSMASTGSPQAASSTVAGYILPNAEQYYGGWLLWDPANIYTEGALEARN